MRDFKGGKFGMARGARAHPVAMWEDATAAAVQVCVRGPQEAGMRPGIGLLGGKTKFRASNTNKEWWQLLGRVIDERYEYERLQRCLGLRMQGSWAADRVMGATYHDEDYGQGWLWLQTPGYSSSCSMPECSRVPHRQICVDGA